MSDLDSGLEDEVIRHALRIARLHGFGRVSLKSGKSRFEATLDRNAPIAPESDAHSINFAVTDLPPADEWAIRSPGVGYFQPSDALKVDAEVEEGMVIGSLRALGIANDVTSSSAGRISEVKVKGGDPVEFGQVLAVVTRS